MAQTSGGRLSNNLVRYISASLDGFISFTTFTWQTEGSTLQPVHRALPCHPSTSGQYLEQGVYLQEGNIDQQCV